MKSNMIYPCLWFDGKAKEDADCSGDSLQTYERSFESRKGYQGFSSNEEI